MSTWTVARIPRVAFVLASIGILVAGTLGLAVPASGASPAPRGSILAPIGHITPTALGPGAPTTNRPSFAQPFRALDPGALRSAKLHAAAIASRGSRGPSIAPRTPLAGLFNNLNRPGLSQPTVAPPDSTGAVGPNNYVEMVNQKIGVYDRNLNLISSTDNGTFTGAGATLSVSDPQIQWDEQGGRWLYAALGVATGANVLIFGWSKTSNPSDLTNGWCRFGIPDGNLLDDYPKLGHDDNFISIGTNVYDDSTNFTFLTANIFVIRKPAAGDTSCSVNTVLYVADAAHPLHNADGSMAFTPVPANTADSSAFGYIVAAHSPVDGTGTSAPKIMVWHWAMVGGSPALVGDGDVAVSTFDIPAPVPQPGTSNTLDSLDARLTQAVAVNDPGAGGAKGIWTQHTVAGPGGRSVVRWYEILGGAPPTLRQQGDVGSPTDFVFNGAVSPSIGGGSAAVFYNRGGASTLPVIGAQTRGPSTPLGNLDAGELILGQSSAADLDFTCGYSKPTDPCRWGDYAGASPDPLNDGVVWGSSQVTGPCFIFCGLFTQWQTQNFAVNASAPSPPPPPPPTTDIPGVQGTWVGTYGVDGYVLGGWTTSGDLSSLPAGVTYSLEQGSRYTWASSTTDVRALQSPDQTGRRSTTWYDTTEVRVRLNFANPYSGTLHLYAVDWNAIGRAENVTIDDGTGPRTAGLTSAFNNGAWVHAPITVGSGGSVLITADNVAGNYNAVINGLFLGGASATSGINLAKSASPTTYNAVGQTITYTYTITNTGNVSLASAQFTVSDDHIGSPLGTAFNCGSPVALAPNGTVSCSRSYTISQADLNAGSVTNKATASGAGLTSNQASATATASVTLPGAPQNLTAVRASTKGVQLNWSAPSSTGGAASVTYNVYRGTSPGGESTTPIVTGLTSTSYLDNSPSLVGGRKYYYKVAAVNTAGRGPYSNEASAKAR